MSQATETTTKERMTAAVQGIMSTRTAAAFQEFCSCMGHLVTMDDLGALQTRLLSRSVSDTVEDVLAQWADDWLLAAGGRASDSPAIMSVSSPSDIMGSHEMGRLRRRSTKPKASAKASAKASVKGRTSAAARRARRWMRQWRRHHHCAAGCCV